MQDVPSISIMFFIFNVVASALSLMCIHMPVIVGNSGRVLLISGWAIYRPPKSWLLGGGL